MRLQTDIHDHAIADIRKGAGYCYKLAVFGRHRGLQNVLIF